jgi:DNA invertase Pin-like site-specific DNA recombinase
MKQLFAYIRVSTAKQGQGVSLQEQRTSIERFAARVGAEIIEWFEERRTAAKTGRPEFVRMMRLLRQGKASGVVIHKIDRSTRNYRDWADIDDLIESGINVHFANDDLDLRSRGGRLAADIQVAMAVDYIRNLREETLKGIHGRLKQGILPSGASIGYLNCGAGKPKEIDPKRGPLVKRLFEAYATGGYTLRDLTAESERIGLRNRNGHALRLQEIHRVIRNPFYAGVIRSTRFGVFQGAHKPLVTRALYDRVQAVLAGKFVRRTKRFAFLFRRLLHCSSCDRSLIGSERKGFVYYRCSNPVCPTTSVREDRVDDVLREALHRITLTPQEATLLEEDLVANSGNEIAVRDAQRASLTSAIAAANARSSRLTDLLIDGTIDSGVHKEKHAELMAERQRLMQELAALEAGGIATPAKARLIVELARRAEILYESADPAQKRRLLEIVMSNCVVTGKTPEFSFHEPFATIANRAPQQTCTPHYDTPRTFSAKALLQWGGALNGYRLTLFNEVLSAG